MKVSELIEHLQKLDGELELWTSIDDEGNGYNALRYDPEIRYVRKEETYSSDSLYCEEDLEESVEDGYCDSIDELKKVVLL